MTRILDGSRTRGRARAGRGATCVAVSCMAAGLAPAAHATLYTDLAAWASAVPGPITTISFDEPYLAGMTQAELLALDLSEYYVPLGLHMEARRVNFPNYQIPITLGLWPDGVDWYARAGDVGNQYFLNVFCDELITAIAVTKGTSYDVVGYRDGVAVETHSFLGGSVGPNQRWGIVFNQPVDRVWMLGASGPMRVHDLSWSTVPSPGALALLALAPTSWRRSRR